MPWEIEDTGRRWETKEIGRHVSPVNVAVYISDTVVVSGGQEGRIGLWNLQTRESEFLGGHLYQVSDVASHDAQLASCGGDRSVMLWDLHEAAIVRRFSGHVAQVNSCTFNDAASVLASASYDGTVKLWDMRSSDTRPLQTLSDSKDSVSHVSICGSNICAASVDGYCRNYDIRHGKMISEYVESPATWSQMLSETDTILVSSLDSCVRQLSLDDGHLVQTFTGYENRAYALKFAVTRDGKALFVGDEKGDTYVYDLGSGRSRMQHVHDGAVLSCDERDGYLVTSGSDGRIKALSSKGPQ